MLLLQNNNETHRNGINGSQSDSGGDMSPISMKIKTDAFRAGTKLKSQLRQRFKTN